ncbi:arylesterase [Flammeovirga kamogawensis]|uniref:Arylesterase n=1 Tax=Flammeovirga kamogawensis TaxID=373891 RepID=A0ABX8GTA6_9BACT|nr:arylesterase [Flammeovirga kamogawensis]MBB6461506.1 acyl-CoA thioesterase-1 [Flammeovirga kamogawensis]QWG06397.1 arylesterase [Flammeovirga kamogawensis]TRX68227.1 arylesterase [Flammeovirga kamogawensis]
MKNIRIFSIIILLSISSLFSCSNTSNNENTKHESTKTEVRKSIEKDSRKVITFYGNSLTAGYGLEKEQSYPSIIQATYDSLNIPYHCINAGLSGETTAGGKNRIEWVLNQNTPDIFVLSLGGNDALRGLDPKSSKENLIDIINIVRTKNPNCKILLAGIVPPPNMGEKYFNEFKLIFPQISKEKNTFLLPFLLKGVAGNETLNQKDGIHPNIEGTKIVASTVMNALKPLL